LKNPKDKERDIFCSFMGKLSGPNDRTGVRSLLYRKLKDRSEFYFSRGSIPEFIDVTSRSVFTLCPRGYGRTSFRLYEAMNLGSIPVYIWDDMEWLPYKDLIDWSSVGVSLHVDDIDSLPGILRSHSEKDIREKQTNIASLSKSYFSYEGTCSQIVRYLLRKSNF